MKNFMKSKLPEIIVKNNREKIFDPIRKKFFNANPEEIVRQHVISYLVDELKVPKNLIFVEEHLSHYGIDSNERADIVVEYEEKNIFYPLLVIECKAPEIFLDDKAREQLFGYSEKLGNKYCWLTNGEENYFYFLKDDEYIEIDEIPNYFEMLGKKYNLTPIEEFKSRSDFEKLEEKYFDYVDEENIGEDTPKNLAIPMTNFLECLMDLNHKFPEKKYKIFSVVKDYGIRNLNVGNNSGYGWSGSYRSFLVKYNDIENFVSLTVYIDDPIYICIAVDRDGKTVHHSLQLNVEKNLITYDKKIRFLHNGKMAVGNKGTAPVDGLRKLVSEKYPEIIYGKNFYLGTLTNNRLWTLDDEEVMKVVENLIAYALIRDDYRSMF